MQGMTSISILALSSKFYRVAEHEILSTHITLNYVQKFDAISISQTRVLPRKVAVYSMPPLFYAFVVISCVQARETPFALRVISGTS